MLKNKISALVREFSVARDDEAIKSVFAQLRDLVIFDAKEEVNGNPDLRQSISDTFTKMESAFKDELYKSYVNAFNSIFLGDIKGYLAAIERFIISHIKKHGGFTYEQAYRLIVVVLVNLLSDDNQLRLLYKKLVSILKKHMPESAFYAYMDYLTKNFKSYNSKIKALRNILEIDPNWYAAYVKLGGVYYSEKEWDWAFENYKAAVDAGELWRTDWVYFNMAWCCDKTRRYADSVKYYKKCLEINQHYKYANNNLGYAYKLLKDYDQALLYFDKSIALGTDGRYPFRNKLETLIQTGRNDEAISLAKEHPGYFNTKHHKELINKASGGETDMDEIFKELTATTEIENAGIVSIAQSNSGLQLREHQRDAILEMNRKILHTDNYAGLLVLPTGGGKTLTAAHWLMSNILDNGYKIIWIAHRHELLNQALRDGFKKVSYRDIAKRKKQYSFRVISGQHDRPVNIKPTDDVLIASKTSLHRGFHHLEKWLSGSDVFMVIDEAHHATAKEYRELIGKIRESVPSLKILGLTATPFRTADNERGALKKEFRHDIVFKIDLRELINRGFLAEPIFEEVETHTDMQRLFQAADGEAILARIQKESFFDIETIGKNIATAIAENAERNNLIVSRYDKKKYGKTLVFALNKKMAIALNKVFRMNGIKSDYVVSDIRDAVTGVVISSKENEDKIRRFRGDDLGEKEEELDVLINVNILTEGTDLPKVKTVFLTRPTKSTILMTQMIGRALRGEEAGGTKEAYIVSFVDEWRSKIAWVNPKQLHIGNTASPPEPGRPGYVTNLVAIQKIEEFAAIANGTIDPIVLEKDFAERIPVGIYHFSYLVPVEGDEDEAIYCDILVYECMQKAYEEELFPWIPGADLEDVDAAVRHISDTIFTETDRLIGYREEDVKSIIHYYKQNGELPELIELPERDEYNVKHLAQHIIDEKLDANEEAKFMNDKFYSGESRWGAFFGINNFKAFRMAIRTEKDKIIYEDDYKPTPDKPITTFELRQIQDLPLHEIRQKFPKLGEKLRDDVFKRFTDTDGYYFSARTKNGKRFRSRNRLDFQIDHITPRREGGKTIPENLQLLTKKENGEKG